MHVYLHMFMYGNIQWAILPEILLGRDEVLLQVLSSFNKIQPGVDPGAKIIRRGPSSLTNFFFRMFDLPHPVLYRCPYIYIHDLIF